jgi:hypothetical protein
MKAQKRKRASVTDGLLTNKEKLESGVERGLLSFKDSPLDEWPGLAAGYVVALPGSKGHRAYLYNIRDRLKKDGFVFNNTVKLWYRSASLVG